MGLALIKEPTAVLRIVARCRPLPLSSFGRLDRHTEVGDHRSFLEASLLLEVGLMDLFHLPDMPQAEYSTVMVGWPS